MFLYYVAIIRPLEKIWSEDVFGATKAIFYRHQVFVRYATPMETVHFSKVLYNSTQEFLHIGLGLRDYRQFIKSVLRVVLRLNHDEDEDHDSDQIDITDASFGHSSDIGENFYGLSLTDLPSLSDELVSRHQAYCQRVHRWLGEGEPLPEHMDPIGAGFSELTTMLQDIRSLVKEAIEHGPSKESIVSTSQKAAHGVFKDIITDVLVPVIQETVRTELRNLLQPRPSP
jgi:hypothetical protein